MARAIMELSQVCHPCIQLIANGEAWENHVDISAALAENQRRHLGGLARHLVMSCSADGEGTCPREVIGACEACGLERESGYWWPHQAAIVYSGEVTVGAEARALAAEWQSAGMVGHVLAELASTGSADIDSLKDDMEMTVIHFGGLFSPHETYADRDMARLMGYILAALKEEI